MGEIFKRETQEKVVQDAVPELRTILFKEDTEKTRKSMRELLTREFCSENKCSEDANREINDYMYHLLKYPTAIQLPSQQSCIVGLIGLNTADEWQKTVKTHFPNLITASEQVPWDAHRTLLHEAGHCHRPKVVHSESFLLFIAKDEAYSEAFSALRLLRGVLQSGRQKDIKLVTGLLERTILARDKGDLQHRGCASTLRAVLALDREVIANSSDSDLRQFAETAVSEHLPEIENEIRAQTGYPLLPPRPPKKSIP